MREKHTLRLRDDYLSLEVSNCLKGILALIIIFAHIRNSLVVFNDTIIGQILTASGYLCVAVYLFLSGYGLVHQYLEKGKNYLNDFPKRRLLDLFVKYLILMLVYAVYHMLTEPSFNATEILLSFIPGKTIVIFGWYIQAIFITYILFYVFMQFFSEKFKEHLIFIIALITVTYIILCSCLDLELIWFQSFLAFPTGMVWAYKKCKIDKYMQSERIFMTIIVISFIAFCITLLLGNYNILASPYKQVVKMISAPCFSVFVVLSLKIVNIKNLLTMLLGNVSFELYVIHGLVLSLLRSSYIYIDNDIIFVVAVFVISGILACLLHRIFSHTNAKIRGN